MMLARKATNATVTNSLSTIHVTRLEKDLAAGDRADDPPLPREDGHSRSCAHWRLLMRPDPSPLAAHLFPQAVTSICRRGTVSWLLALAPIGGWRMRFDARRLRF